MCYNIGTEQEKGSKKRKNEVNKMKKYVITCEDTYNTLHKNVGGCAYVAIAFGTHNELAKYIKENNIDMNELA